MSVAEKLLLWHFSRARPAVGYTVPYAVGNPLLTMCGIAIVMLMT
jgi:hypothetical protein